MIEYRILGPLQVRRDGAEVALTAPKLKSLLLALLLRPNEAVSTDHLIDALWPNHAPETAAKLVHVYVSQLRSALGADAIETVAKSYRVIVEPAGLDSSRFLRMSDDGRRALADGNPELALALARRASSLWRGPALADVAYESFAAPEAARLEESRLHCLEDELDAQLALGRHEDVIPDLRRLSAEFPARERVRTRLALALYRSDRQSEALDALATCRHALLEQLGLEPAQEHQALERAILEQDPALDHHSPNADPAHRLPAPTSTLVGRQLELAQLLSLVSREEVRLVTVSGAGGSGKTRVALELARSAAPRFANGGAFVELAAIHDPQLLTATIASALGIAETAGEPVAEALARWLHNRDLLLVLDNFEHVIDAATELGRLVESAPRLTVVVTSRRVLHVTGEHVFPLSPLPLADAMQLFSVRASVHGSSVVDDRDDAADVVAEICRRLDCLPLAVELAAARALTFSPQLILERLTDRIAVLGRGPRDAPARQQTLTDTLRWSTDLLRDDERRTLARFTVFAGTCSVEAAEAICLTDIQQLGALIDSNLLQRTAIGGTVRLSMLRTVDEYAAELLDAESRADAEKRHASYYAAFVEGAKLTGPGQAEALAMVDADLDNLRVAMDRSDRDRDDDTALRIATALYRYYYLRAHFREGRDRILRPLEREAGDLRLQALALRGVAGLHYMLGELDQAEDTAVRGIAVGATVGADYAVMACHTVMSHVARERGDFEAAMQHLVRSESIARDLGLDEDVIVANTNLGELALALGNLHEARQRWEQTLSWFADDDENSTFALLGLGAVAAREGLLDEAQGHFSRARALSEREGWLHNTTMALIGLADVAAERSDQGAAARLLGHASGLLDATGAELTIADGDVYERARCASLDSLGHAEWTKNFDAGRTDAAEATIDSAPRSIHPPRSD